MAPTVMIPRSVLLAQAGRPVPPVRPDGVRPLAQVVVLGAAALMLLGVLVPRAGDHLGRAPQTPGSGTGTELVDGARDGGTTTTTASTTTATTARLTATGSTAGQTDARTPQAPSTGSAPDGRTTSSCVAPCTTSQVVSVTILPGPLTVSGGREPVALRAGPDGTGTGTLEGITVTDTRGAEPGWTLAASVASVTDGQGRALAGARVEVVPTCTRTAGPLTLEDADPSIAATGQHVGLCLVPTAAAGSRAGGVVTVTASLTVRDAPADTVVRVRLTPALA